MEARKARRAIKSKQLMVLEPAAAGVFQCSTRDVRRTRKMDGAAGKFGTIRG